MKKLSKTIIVLLAISVLGYTQFLYDLTTSARANNQIYLPPSKSVKIASLGLESAFADYFWLKSIQYFGAWRENYDQLYDHLDLATDLDPKFEYPYAFGTLMLPSIKDTEQAIQISDKGMKNVPESWEIPYYRAVLEYTDLDDRADAIKYFDVAASKQNAPDNIKRVAASFGTRPDIREETKQIWISVYENSDDKLVRERAEAYVYHYEILDLLEKAAEIYKEQYGEYPKSPDKLVETNILKEVPEDPFGFIYEFSDTGRAEIVVEE